MLFNDIIGQQRTKSLLSQLAASGRVPHALLFLGPTGSGNLALAVAFAQMLQCERWTEDVGLGKLDVGRSTGDVGLGTGDAGLGTGDWGRWTLDMGQGTQDDTSELVPSPTSPVQRPQSPVQRPTSPVQNACGECPACRKAAAFAHPDIHFSFPTIGTNAVSTDFLKQWRAFLTENPYADANSWLQRLGADNKQGNINKEECNAILKKLSLKAFEGRYKILVMWLPEYLGKEGNRLLKLIEEPPDQTIFLLAAENQELILNTILSRCQLVKTDLLADAEVAEALEQKRGLDTARACQIAFLAGGNLDTALSLADNPDNDDGRLLLDWLRRCWRGNGVEMVRWTDEFAKLGRENQKQFLHYGLHFLREMMSLVATGNAALRLGPEELSTAQNMAKVLNFEKITQIASILNDNIYYVERNANPKILFLDTSIQLHKIMKSA